MSKEDRIFVAGHGGMVGAAIVRKLREIGYTNLVTRTRTELDLVRQADVRKFFESERVDQVYLAAAKVGGILANDTYPAEFIYQNLMIEANIIHEAWHAGVAREVVRGGWQSVQRREILRRIEPEDGETAWIAAGRRNVRKSGK